MKHFLKTAIYSLILGLLIASTTNSFFALASSSSGSISLSGSDQSQTLSCEDDPLDAAHVHAYENITQHSTGYTSYMAIYRFRIYLHDDFMDDVDLNNIECSVPSGGTESDGNSDGWVPCDGGTSTEYGGVEVNFIENDTSSDAEYPDYVEWEYGLTTSSSRPVAPGKNDYDLDGSVDNVSSERTIGETIYFQFDDYVTSSATTTSAIEIEFWKLDEDCYTSGGGGSCWSAVEEDGVTGLHWNVDSVTDYTDVECLTCDTLDIVPSTGSLSVDDLAAGYIDFNATVTDTSGADITSDSEINWMAFDYNSTQPSFTDTPDASGEFRWGYSDSWGNTNDLTVNATREVSYYNAESGDWILAKVEGTDSGVCEAVVQLPYCSDLSITSPSSGSYSGSFSADITVDVEASTGEDWPYTIEWDSNASDATFDGTTPAYETDNTSGTGAGWTVAYESSEDGRITVRALDNPAGFCMDTLDYSQEPVDDPGDSGDSGDSGDTGNDDDDDDDDVLPTMGDFDKFIYTFNFSPEQSSDDFYDTFFTHNADRAFYTLDYEPTGTETEITFRDDLWSGNISSEEGGELVFVDDINILTAEISQGDDTEQYGRYSRYQLINRMGFLDENFNENADNIGYTIEIGDYYNPVVPYITFDNLDPAVLIEECVYTDNEEGESELTSTEICVENVEESLNDSDEVILLNVDSLFASYDPDEISIRMRYVAIVNNGLDCTDETDACLTEKFINTAEVDLGQGVTEEAQALLASLCQYLVTRNAGDIFLEEQLDGGSDIACIYEGTEFDTADYRNVDALVISDSGEEETGTDEIDYTYNEYGETVDYGSGFAGLSVSWCDDNEGTEGGLISNLSSYVCEIITSVAELWNSDTIESTTSSQISQAVRNAETDQALLGNTASSWDSLVSSLSNKNNPESGVLYYQGTGEGDVLTLGSLSIDEGAWTLIVTDADVRISGNIEYNSATSGTDYKNLPAFAIIVEGGDIDISSSVSSIHAFMVTDQKFTGDERSEVDQQLVIYGSLYGNVQDLFDSAQYVGSPSTTIPGGGLVIYYDETIILNTPPYLSEKVDIYTEEAVN